MRLRKVVDHNIRRSTRRATSGQPTRVVTAFPSEDAGVPPDAHEFCSGNALNSGEFCYEAGTKFSAVRLRLESV